MKNVVRPKLRSDWSSVDSGGMQLEISATIDGLAYQLVTILADDKDEALWVQVYVGDTAVQMPIGVLRDALDAAVAEVHSESWYDKHHPPEREA